MPYLKPMAQFAWNEIGEMLDDVSGNNDIGIQGIRFRDKVPGFFVRHAPL